MFSTVDCTANIMNYHKFTSVLQDGSMITNNTWTNTEDIHMKATENYLTKLSLPEREQLVAFTSTDMVVI